MQLEDSLIRRCSFPPDSSSGCAQCQTCPGGTEALQTAAKDCAPCRPGRSQICRAPTPLSAICYRQCYNKQWHLALNRYAQAPPSDSVSNLQQRFLPDPLGPGKLRPLPGESLLPCENSAWPEKSNLCAVTKSLLYVFVTRTFSSFRVLMWVPFSVPVMHSVQRAVWPPVSAWRLSSVKQEILVNLLLSPLLC